MNSRSAPQRVDLPRVSRSHRQCGRLLVCEPERRAAQGGPVVRGAIETVELSAQAKRIVPDVQFDAEAPLIVSADDLRLRPAISNLLANAIKFSRDSGLVQVGVTRMPSRATVRVVDHGVGIEAAADLPRVFERFWQHEASPSNRSGGLGLGLAIPVTSWKPTEASSPFRSPEWDGGPLSRSSCRSPRWERKCDAGPTCGSLVVLLRLPFVIPAEATVVLVIRAQ